MRVLDVGCGDMSLADALVERNPAFSIECIDIHPCPVEMADIDPRWLRYRQFDGVHLPFEPNSFDAVIFSDVLHHSTEGSCVSLLADASRVGRWVLVKDHLERGLYSRHALRVMDFIGNFGYGVPVPARYLDRSQFDRLCMIAGLSLVSMTIGIELYSHLPVLRNLVRPEWQFIAVAERVDWKVPERKRAPN
jgi:SAM-dependent methyltransferase